MKKYIAYANYFIATAGVIAALMRKSLLRAGTDGNGLYPAAHLGWMGYLVLTAAVVAILWFATKGQEHAPQWAGNFPKSPLHALSHVLCGIAIALYNLPLLASADRLTTFSCYLGIVCAAALILLGVQHFAGQAPAAMAYLIPCMYFALLLFSTGKANSDEPELLRFLPQLFALGASTLAAYHLWGFGVGCGNRGKSLFWSLSAAYLCLAAAPGAPIMYGAIGLWHLLGHCSLTPPPAVQEAETPTETEEIPAEIEEIPEINQEN